ncbi:MAG TPA: YraN family protein [bacterium]|nr:YraN family protein [bacterium]HOR57713.1 YraN family protein [bacterium]HPL56459.1 YraN family protein [bacterium]
MSRDKKNLGDWGEEKAAKYLAAKKYHILGKKVRTICGEIDILAQEKDTLVVVEVKTKTSVEQGAPEEMVDWKKQKKLVRLAQEVNQKFPQYGIRIDVIAIEEKKIRHYINAVLDDDTKYNS